MGNGNDSILEAYLFETNSLLEQLDSLVLAAEEKDSFSEEDVNTIFRIMHTIKGSSAMMEYSSLMTIAHRAEDLFAIVRDKSMEIVPEALRPALFDLLAKTGNIPERDMFNTFNMGVGMILIVAAEDADKAIEILKANDQDAYRLGVIADGDGVELV